MNGMEFTWKMATVLAWPAVAFFVLVIYRNRITSSLSAMTKGARVKRLKAGPVDVELEWDPAVSAAGQDTASALERMPQPPADGAVPTSLVDMIKDVNENPRAGMRAAFNLVLRALAEAYPQLTSVAPRHLTTAMQRLVRQGDMSAEVEWTVSQLYQLLEISQLNSGAGQAQGYDFLMLAEAAIHVIIRSTRVTAQNEVLGSLESAPISTQWRGRYNDNYQIELRILTWNSNEFDGTMTYPESDTVTRVTGRIEPTNASNNSVTITWEEKGYEQQGRRRIEFNGYYKARIADATMKGEWYYQGSPRIVAEFEMKAADA